MLIERLWYIRPSSTSQHCQRAQRRCVASGSRTNWSRHGPSWWKHALQVPSRRCLHPTILPWLVSFLRDIYLHRLESYLVLTTQCPLRLSGHKTFRCVLIMAVSFCVSYTSSCSWLGPRSVMMILCVSPSFLAPHWIFVFVISIRNVQYTRIHSTKPKRRDGVHV